MLSQPKSAVHQLPAKLFQQHWRHLKGNYVLNFAFENADRLLEQKRTSSQFDYVTPLSLQSQLVLAFTGRNIFNSITNQRKPQKIFPTRDAYLDLDLTIHVNNISIRLVRQFL